MAHNDFVIEVNEQTFQADVLDRSWQLPVVVDFWAPWCGPCRMLGPVLEKLAVEQAPVFLLAKVNVDHNQGLAVRFGVRGIPAVKIFWQEKVIGEFVGTKGELEVRRLLDRVLPRMEDHRLNEGYALLATHHWREAEAAFRRVLLDFPTDEGAALGLARALLAQGQGQESADLLSLVQEATGLRQVEVLRPLARFLARCEQEDQKEAQSADFDPLALPPLALQYRHSARLLRLGNLEAALDGLLDVLRADKQYLKGEPRLVLLALFELLGPENDLTLQYRHELAMVLF
jgi:putative thioredoxin